MLDSLRILVVSTPKAGNTWVKHLLSGVYQLPIASVGPRFDPGEVDRLGSRWIAHQHYRARRNIIEYGEENNIVFVTVVRHPGDILLSKYHFVRNYVDRLKFSDVDLSPLMARDGEQMGKHTAYYVRQQFHVSLEISLSWIRAGESRVVRYEDLWREPVSALRDLTDSIHRVSRRRLERAVDLCDIDLMRSMSDGQSKFFRKGQVGNWRERLPQEVIEIFRDVDPYRSQFAALGYSLDADDPLTSLPRQARISKNPFIGVTHFDNGVPVPLVAVRLYLSVDPDLCERWPAVGSTAEGSFYAWLNAPVDEDFGQPASMPLVTNLAHYVYSRDQLARSRVPDCLGKDRIAYVVFFIDSLADKYDLDPVFIKPMRDSLAAWGDRPVTPAGKDSRHLEGKPTLTNLAISIYEMRPDLQRAFPNLFGEHRSEFVRWFTSYALASYASSEALAQPVRNSIQTMARSLPDSSDGASLSISSLFLLGRVASANLRQRLTDGHRLVKVWKAGIERLRRILNRFRRANLTG